MGAFGMSISEWDTKNPDPYRYEVIEMIEKRYSDNIFTILLLKYPNCVNYEGRKILVFNKDYESIIKQKCIDPHFSDKDNLIHPIARFSTNR